MTKLGILNLQNLWLNRTPLGDDSFHHLAGLNRLTLLFVEGTRLTDAGICHLDGLKACSQIAVGNTAVTDLGINAAQQNRPKIRFVRIGF